MWREAEQACSVVLEHEPGNVKARYRRARVGVLVVVKEVETSVDGRG